MIKRDSGVISLLTAIMVSVLVISVSMGLLILTTGGTQQASDDELSLRAYAAANGAVEWAYWDAIHGSKTQNLNCNAAFTNNFNIGATSDNAVTCVKIRTSGNAFSGNLPAGDAKQIIVEPNVVPLEYIQVDWLDQGQGDVPYPTGGYSIYAPGGSVFNNLPPQSGMNKLPAIELTIVNYATTSVGPGGQINPGGPGLGDISVRNVALLPNDFLSTNDGTAPPTPLKKIAVPCVNAATGPQCSTGAGLVIAGNSNTALTGSQGAIIYIRSLYPNQYPGANGSHFAIKLIDINGGVMTVPTQSTTIDVTARSGPVYRRIQAIATPPTGSIPAGLNYVLFSDNEICKNFSITSNASLATTTGSCVP